jgi:hypothetical protein
MRTAAPSDMSFSRGRIVAPHAAQVHDRATFVPPREGLGKGQSREGASKVSVAPTERIDEAVLYDAFLL